MLNRRHALMGAAAALLPLRALADEWSDAFRNAFKGDPKLLGYVTPPDRLETAALTVEGKWPAELAGTFYRNGPARHDVGTLRFAIVSTATACCKPSAWRTASCPISAA